MGSATKTKTQHNKSKVLPHLPPELWTEVLARLPVKILLRFRAVCKTWCSMIDDPDFLLMHRSLFKNNVDKNHLLVMSSGLWGDQKFRVRVRDNLTITTHIRQKSKSFKILGNCNGLVLLEDYEKWDKSHNNNRMRFVSTKLWNPSTQKSIVLPSCPGYKDVVIIGFVPSSNEHKVVVFEFPSRNLSSSTTFSVYSVSDHLWRTKTVMIDFPVISLHCMFWFVKYGHVCDYYSHGAAHWLVSEGERQFTHVLSFDFGMESFRYVKLPVVEDPEMVMNLFNLGESLAVFGISNKSSCIWVMTSENNNDNPWSVWFTGDSSSDGYKLFCRGVSYKRHFYGLFPRRLPHSLYKKLLFDENTSTFIVIYNKYDEPMSYNIITHKVGRVRKHRAGLRIKFVDTYVESLALCRGREDQTLLR
ncbi:F-box/kelch-repeat protein At3g23880-like [Spinacia oleracea]|uniref:F-box/kelch-repeat protein At3g23880-like n=1 Tax=Spinacia oleracea TaxID=3562 RepID=A0A9R0JVD8_SPIOL|nr:F-box/kelch-repeat protein At3g23880-like [Spinacia oleracea]